MAAGTPDTPDTPEAAPLFERFTVTYPSGTVIESYYPGGATLREVQVTHPLAVVEVVEASLVGGGFPHMKGIHAALQGRLGADVELRRSQSGKDWCRLSVGVGEGEECVWVSVAVFEEKAARLTALLKGAEVYVEGRLSLNTWTGKDGAQRTGLSVAAWEVIPLGRIGRKRPRSQSRGIINSALPRQSPAAEAPPFDDPLTF